MPPTPELYEAIRNVFNEGIPFNRHLGLRLTHCEEGKAVIEIPFKPEFIGDVAKNIVHGGIISTLVDVTGGATAFTVLNVPHEISLNTVDMRVDYVRMGRGNKFIAQGTVIRKGNRICVTRIEIHNDEGVLVAIGTATYSIFTASEKSAADARKRYGTMLSLVTEGGDESEPGAEEESRRNLDGGS